MSFRFRKRIRLGKGLYMDIGKRGITSISKRAGRVTVTAGKRGMHETVNLGRGLSAGCLVPIVAIPATIAAVWFLVH